jgi:N-acetylneuraminate synthase
MISDINNNKKPNRFHQQCYIIAEAGVNHNGDIDLAKKLVAAAKKSGADAIKFQTFLTEELVSKDCSKPVYQKRSSEKTQWEMLRKLELSFDEFEELKKLSDRKKIEFISTPYDRKSIDFLDTIGVKKFKIASADLINKPLIERVAKTDKHIILSLGMASIDEIIRSVKYIESFGNKDISLLHCTTSYPTPYNEVNMKLLPKLQQLFDYPIGYSDHTVGIEISIMAVSMGAKIIEKHFTLDRTMEGPDHFASSEPKEFAKMTQAIRNVECAFGTSEKDITSSERQNIFFMRRSIHAARKLKRGEIIEKNCIKITRPFDGLEPWLIEKIIGKKIKTNIKKDDPITMENF